MDKYNTSNFVPLTVRLKRHPSDFTLTTAPKKSRDPNKSVFTPTRPTISRTQRERYANSVRFTTHTKFIER